MDNRQLVTVIIPVFNAGAYLRPAVENIINQTYSNLEIIIVNDGSSDNCISTITDLIKQDKRISLINQENAGKAAALNRALDIMKGDFWVMQDADDISYPRRIEKQLQAMQENPELAAVYVGYNLMLNNVRFAPTFDYISPRDCKDYIRQFAVPGHDATGMYRSAFTEHLRFDETLRSEEGIDFIIRLGEEKPIMLLGECLYTYRINYGSLTRRDRDFTLKYINIVKQKTYQRRNPGAEEFGMPVQKKPGFFKHRDFDTQIVVHCMDSVLQLRRIGKFIEALKVATVCLRIHPFDWYYYKPLFYSVLPLKLISSYRAWKDREFC
jgi:glycosyltransferase involved in cell wall biosynthesis